MLYTTALNYIVLRLKINNYSSTKTLSSIDEDQPNSKGNCCDVAIAQINYPNFKHNTQDNMQF